VELKTSSNIVGQVPYNVPTKTYKRNNNCRLNEETITNTSPKFPNFATQKPLIRRYEYDTNDSLIKVLVELKDSIKEYGFVQYERFANGKLKTLFRNNVYDDEINNQDINGPKIGFEYDSIGRLKIISNYYQSTNTAPYQLHNQVFYSYNTEGLLVLKKQKYLLNPRSICADTETEYNYYCDNLLKETIIKAVDAGCDIDFRTKIVYYYTNVAPCKQEPLAEITLFPNPTRDVFSVKSAVFLNGDWSIKVVNVSGKSVHNKSLNARTDTFDVFTEGWAAGVYFVTLTNGKEMITKKFVIQN
jgi:hypothetical protein